MIVSSSFYSSILASFVYVISWLTFVWYCAFMIGDQCRKSIWDDPIIVKSAPMTGDPLLRITIVMIMIIVMVVIMIMVIIMMMMMMMMII